jgi:hypothetical protein
MTFRLKVKPGTSPREILRLWKLAGIPTSGGVYERIYKRVWAQMMRERKEYRDREAVRQRQRRSDPVKRAAALAGTREWKARHRRHISGYNKRYRENKKSTCYSCGKQSSQRTHLWMTERFDVAANRMVSVKWCRHC